MELAVTDMCVGWHSYRMLNVEPHTEQNPLSATLLRLQRSGGVRQWIDVVGTLTKAWNGPPPILRQVEQ